MFYEVFNGINYENSVSSNGLASHQSSATVSFDKNKAPDQQTPTFPNILTNTGNFGTSSNISIVDPNFHVPYILESSLEVQRELFANTTLTIGTLWTHGVHLISSNAYDLNLFPPTGTTTYIAPGATVTLPNLDGGLLTEGRLTGAVSQIDALISPGTNRYNSLYVQLQRRVTQGLALMTSYTFSKTMQANGTDFNNQFDFSNTRGPSLLDQRHRLSIAAVYAPNTERLQSAFARTLLSHWAISTVMQFNSGRPYTAILSNNAVNNSAVNEGTGNTSGGLASGSAPSPTQGYNAFYGPWIDEIDLGIARGFHITERHVITFKVQAFNLFNHPNFFVQNGNGINATQFDTNGANCGDGKTQIQQCFLTPDPGFQTKNSISQLNGPRILQFSFSWKF